MADEKVVIDMAAADAKPHGEMNIVKKSGDVKKGDQPEKEKGHDECVESNYRQSQTSTVPTLPSSPPSCTAILPPAPLTRSPA